MSGRPLPHSGQLALPNLRSTLQTSAQVSDCGSSCRNWFAPNFQPAAVQQSLAEILKAFTNSWPEFARVCKSLPECAKVWRSAAMRNLICRNCLMCVFFNFLFPPGLCGQTTRPVRSSQMKDAPLLRGKGCLELLSQSAPKSTIIIQTSIDMEEFRRWAIWHLHEHALAHGRLRSLRPSDWPLYY